MEALFAGLEAPVVVACSGGPDSLALLALAAAAGLGPVAVHVDHGARPGSAAEADVVAGFAERLGTGFAAETVAVPPGPNFEARAREARYGALEVARARLGATAVLVGHSRDDQAETVLLNVLRGAGVPGLAGHADPPGRRSSGRSSACPGPTWPAVCAGPRPVPRSSDPMNADPAHRRVWLRREVIPALEAGAARDLRAVLARQAALARADSDLLDELAGEVLTRPAQVVEPIAVPAADSGVDSDCARQRSSHRALDVAGSRRPGGAGPACGPRSWLGAAAALVGRRRAVLAIARGEPAGGRPAGRGRDQPGGGSSIVVDSGVARAAQRATARRPVPVELPGAAAGFGVELDGLGRAGGARPVAGRAVDGGARRRPGRGAGGAAAGRGRASGSCRSGSGRAQGGEPTPWPKPACRPNARAGHPVLAGPAGWESTLGARVPYRRPRPGLPGTRRFLWVTVEAGG